MSAHVIRLPYTSAPLRSNDRLHHMAKARTVRSIRDVACVVGSHHVRTWPELFPISTPVVVTLVWEVCDKRVRDAGSIAPTGKAAIDGLVDAGVLASDRHTVVTEERYRIEVGSSKGLRIEIAAA